MNAKARITMTWRAVLDAARAYGEDVSRTPDYAERAEIELERAIVEWADARLDVAPGFKFADEQRRERIGTQRCTSDTRHLLGLCNCYGR